MEWSPGGGTGSAGASEALREHLGACGGGKTKPACPGWVSQMLCCHFRSCRHRRLL